MQIMVAAFLDEASRCGDSRVMAMAKRILKLERSVWAFVNREGVDPTIHFAERLIRPAVMWRKVGFSTDCVTGSRFVERMLTAVVTLRLQCRSVLVFLTPSLLQDHCENGPPPHLYLAEGSYLAGPLNAYDKTYIARLGDVPTF